MPAGAPVARLGFDTVPGNCFAVENAVPGRIGTMGQALALTLVVVTLFPPLTCVPSSHEVVLVQEQPDCYDLTTCPVQFDQEAEHLPLCGC